MAVAEAFSPELVLVSPELREDSLTRVPAWQVAVAEAACRQAVLEADAEAAGSGSLVQIAQLVTLAFGSATAATLALTLIADALR
jgi:hypothetical protein